MKAKRKTKDNWTIVQDDKTRLFKVVEVKEYNGW